jgi:hypothetical protein
VLGSDAFESYLSWGKILPRDSFVQLQGVTEFPADSAFNDELVFRAAAGRTLTFGSQHIMAATGFRVPITQRSSRDVEFVFYLLWDWFDGGVRQGW